MSDIKYTYSDIKKKMHFQAQKIAHAPPDVKHLWFQARKAEIHQQISSKEQEIKALLEIRIKDLQVQLGMLKMDLEAITEIENAIQVKGIEYLTEDKKTIEVKK